MIILHSTNLSEKLVNKFFSLNPELFNTRGKAIEPNTNSDDGSCEINVQHINNKELSNNLACIA